MRWRFVDSVLAFEPWKRIVAVKSCSLEEYCLLERWGDTGVSPGILIVESCIQAARWLVEASSAFALSIDPKEISFWRAEEGLKPGERLCMEVSGENPSGRVIHLCARYARLAAKMPERTGISYPTQPGLEFSVSLEPLGDRDSPKDRAALWNELRV